MDSSIAVSVSDLSVRYGARTALSRVSFTARFGEVTAILGPNGAGKSTLLKAAAGLVHAEGRIDYDGRPLGDFSRLSRARFAAYVPQRSNLDAALSVREVVEQGRHPHRSPLARLGSKDRAAIERAAVATEVVAFMDRAFTALSGGEQRRVLVARALATEAPVILLDEPTESLDVAHVLDLHALLGRLAADGRAIVTVLHGLDDARRFTHRALLLQDGAAVKEGPTTEVIAADIVRSVYAVDMVEAGALGFVRSGTAA